MATHVEPQQAAEIIGSASESLRERHDHADRAHAALAGLRLIRQAYLDQAGYDAMRQYEDWLRERLGEHERRMLLATGDRGLSAFPAAGEGCYRAVQIVCDAVCSCFFLNAYAADNGLLLAASDALLESLVEQAEGVPAWPLLVTGMEQSPHVPAATAMQPQSPVLLQ
jgi:hypothetical protein